MIQLSLRPPLNPQAHTCFYELVLPNYPDVLALAGGLLAFEARCCCLQSTSAAAAPTAAAAAPAGRSPTPWLLLPLHRCSPTAAFPDPDCTAGLAEAVAHAEGFGMA